MLSKQRPDWPHAKQRNTNKAIPSQAFAPFRPDLFCPGTPWDPRTNEVVCLYLSPHWPCFSGWESHEHRHAEARGNAHRGHPPTTREASSTLYVLNTRTAPGQVILACCVCLHMVCCVCLFVSKHSHKTIPKQTATRPAAHTTTQHNQQRYLRSLRTRPSGPPFVQGPLGGPLDKRGCLSISLSPPALFLRLGIA